MDFRRGRVRQTPDCRVFPPDGVPNCQRTCVPALPLFPPSLVPQLYT
jgi:hypothetical protein